MTFVQPTSLETLSFAPGCSRAIPDRLRESKFPVRWVEAKQVWEVDVRPHGRIRSVLFPGSVSPTKLVTRKMAVEVRKTILKDIQRGVPEKIAVSPFLPRESRLDRWGERWLEQLDDRVAAGKRSPTYVRRLRHYVHVDWEPLHALSIHSIGLLQLEDFEQELRLRHPNATTVLHILSALRTCLRWVAKRSAGTYVAPEFPELERASYTAPVLEPGQQAAILEKIDVESRGIFLALADLMIRPGEGRALDVGDYDFKTRELRIAHAMKGPRKDAPRGTTKGRDRRLLVVTRRLSDWIEAHVDAEARLRREIPLFANPVAVGEDLRWPESTLRHAWEAAARAAGGPVVGLYVGTKHSTATWLRREGFTLDELGLAMGHSWATREKKVTEGYAQPPRIANETIVRLLDGRGR